jgi:hypothetical protein
MARFRRATQTAAQWAARLKRAVTAYMIENQRCRFGANNEKLYFAVHITK